MEEQKNKSLKKLKKLTKRIQTPEDSLNQVDLKTEAKRQSQLN